MNGHHDAIVLLATQTMKEAGRITPRFPQVADLKDNNPDQYFVRVSAALRVEMKAQLPSILDEWGQGLEANIGEGWLAVMGATQATGIALRAMTALQGELIGAS